MKVSDAKLSRIKVSKKIIKNNNKEMLMIR